MKFPRASVFSWLTLLLLVAGTATVSWRMQAPISRQGGLGWDGVDYHQMARQLAAGQRPHAEAPFVYRIGAPAVAAWLGQGDGLLGFRRLNAVASVVAPLLLFGWLGLHGLSRPTRLVLSLAFATQWHAPLRLTPFYPVHVDPLMWLFWLSALLLLEVERGGPRKWLVTCWWLWILPAVAVREVLLLPAIALVLASQPLLLQARSWADWRDYARQHLQAWRWGPLLGGVAVFALIHRWAIPTNDYGFVTTALSWLWQKSPMHLAHGLGLAFGPLLLVLVLLHWQVLWSLLRRRQDLLLLAVAVLGLGWVGGSDTERLLYWGAPLALLGAGLAWEALWPRLRPAGVQAWLWLGSGLVLQAISQRLAWTIPDDPGSQTLVLPLLTPLSSSGRYLDLWSQHARPEVQVLGLFGHVLAVALLWHWARNLLRPGTER